MLGSSHPLSPRVSLSLLLSPFCVFPSSSERLPLDVSVCLSLLLCLSPSSFPLCVCVSERLSVYLFLLSPSISASLFVRVSFFVFPSCLLSTYFIPCSVPNTSAHNNTSFYPHDDAVSKEQLLGLFYSQGH